MELREINVLAVTECVAELCITANRKLPNGIEKSILSAANNETEPLPKSIMCDICRNLEVAHNSGLPICQDTGMAVVFLEIGQDVHFTGGDLYTAVNEGVKRGYENGLLRKSVVSDPLNRNNTGDNTPAVIHTKIVNGNKVKITVAPKGFGSENMSAVKMLTPHDAEQGVIDFVVGVVKKAGANPCPPIVVGVGIGGDFEQCALLAKQALCGVGDSQKSEYYKALEQKLLSEINKLGIGPQGFGGKTTALAVNIEYAPTHIAGLPVAVNIGCHVTRHASKII